MTNITILAWGSRGDVQPFVALGQALQASGYAVTICAGHDFEDFVQTYGLRFASAGLNFRSIIYDELMPVLESGRNVIRGIRKMTRTGLNYLEVMVDHAIRACEGSDLVIGGTIGGLFGYQYADMRGLPFIYGLPSPFPTRTREFPSIAYPLKQSPGGGFNLLTHDLTQRVFWSLLAQPVNQWRQDQGLPALRDHWSMQSLHDEPVTNLHAYSRHLILRPSDWHDSQIITGYWFLDAPDDWTAPDDLVAFLDAGPPPVYIGFGSMSTRNPAETADLAINALKRAGQRGILATGWDGMAAHQESDVFVLESCPHSWLFPRMAALVHHCGAGTTAAGLRSGVPVIPVPFFGDQPFWARQIHRAGVATAPMLRHDLTIESLAAAITRAVYDVPLRERAATLGARIRAEQGVTQAVRVVNQVMDSAAG